MGYLANSLRGASRGPGEALNILTAPTHERWESSLALTGHRFWAVRSGNVKDWASVRSCCGDCEKCTRILGKRIERG